MITYDVTDNLSSKDINYSWIQQNTHETSKYLFKHLSIFINPSCTKQETELLLTLIDSLLLALKQGSTCVRINTTLMELLNKSNLCYIIDLNHVSYKHIPNILKPLSLVLDQNSNLYLYITRYFYYEVQLVKYIKLLQNKNLSNKNIATIDLTNQNTSNNNYEQTSNIFFNYIFKLFNHQANFEKNASFPNLEQINAVYNCLNNCFSIITGGAGSGKTSTITLFLISYIFNKIFNHNINNDMPCKIKINIVAPTGKAALRAKIAVRKTMEFLFFKYQSFFQDELNNITQFNTIYDSIEYTTIHKFLQYQSKSIYFKYNQHNLIDTQLLIIDEASMISMPLFYKLLSAINYNQLDHLIILGDKNQLPSVEEGLVFKPLVEYYDKYINNHYDDHLQTLKTNKVLNHLTISNRNKGDIYKLSLAILGKNFNIIKEILKTNLDNYELLNVTKQILYHDVKRYNTDSEILRVILYNIISHDSINMIDYINYITHLNHKMTQEYLNTQDFNIDDVQLLAEELFRKYNNTILLTSYNNGILGVNELNIRIETVIKNQLNIPLEQLWYVGRAILILENDYALDIYNGDIGICVYMNNQFRILFDNGKYYSINILPAYQLAFAMTIHKSQGSEYNNVILLLPEFTLDNTILSIELLYTAITRAKYKIQLYTTENTLNNIIQTNESDNSQQNLENISRITGIASLLQDLEMEA